MKGLAIAASAPGRITALIAWLCLSAVPALAQVSPCATAVCRGAPAPLIGFGIPAAFAVSSVLLGAKLLRRRRRSQR
jgi:uncharacterized membrane protein